MVDRVVTCFVYFVHTLNSNLGEIEPHLPFTTTMAKITTTGPDDETAMASKKDSIAPRLSPSETDAEKDVDMEGDEAGEAEPSEEEYEIEAILEAKRGTFPEV